MIVMRAALSQMKWRQSALAGLCRLYWYPLYLFARRRGHSPAEINEEIHAFCEALIATGGRFGP
jgi:RNA polymerase sigma-70 factor (ECF subfamily)